LGQLQKLKKERGKKLKRQKFLFLLDGSTYHLSVQKLAKLWTNSIDIGTSLDIGAKMFLC